MSSSQDDSSSDAGVVKVAVLEDDALCRQSLAAAISSQTDMRLVWQAASLDDARKKAAQPVNVLLVDLGLPDGSGLEFIAEIRRAQSDCAVMVSTVFGDDDHLMAAIKAGALGYLLKDLPADAIIEEIRNLHAGGSPINPMMARKLLQYQAGLKDAPPSPESKTKASTETVRGSEDFRLSPRESEVLQLVAKGYILDEVAVKMNITRHTARSFIRRIYQKLQVNSRAEAVKRAMERGLLNDR